MMSSLNSGHASSAAASIPEPIEYAEIFYDAWVEQQLSVEDALSQMDYGYGELMQVHTCTGAVDRSKIEDEELATCSLPPGGQGRVLCRNYFPEGANSTPYRAQSEQNTFCPHFAN